MSSIIDKIYEEVSIIQTREDFKIPLNSIGNKNIKIETMLSNLNKHLNKSDIAFIDYSTGGENYKNINPLNELFCDNIILYTPIDKKYLIKLNEKEEEEISINNIPKELLGKTTANIKFCFNHLGLPINKNRIKPTRIKDITNEKYVHKSFKLYPNVKDRFR